MKFFDDIKLPAGKFPPGSMMIHYGYARRAERTLSGLQVLFDAVLKKESIDYKMVVEQARSYIKNWHFDGLPTHKDWEKNFGFDIREKMDNKGMV